MLTKENVLQRFGIPSGSKVFYVQLGAGKINDINSEIRMVIDAILEDELSYVVLGESLLGDRLSLDIPRVRTIRDYLIVFILMDSIFQYKLAATILFMK